MKNSQPTVNEFLSLNYDLVLNCFINHSPNDAKKSMLSRMQGRSFNLRKTIFEVYCMIFLLIKEPAILMAQLVLRRGGGLSGSYQFHRLYEIRRVIKLGTTLSAVEFLSLIHISEPTRPY